MDVIRSGRMGDDGRSRLVHGTTLGFADLGAGSQKRQADVGEQAHSLATRGKKPSRLRADRHHGPLEHITTKVLIVEDIFEFFHHV